tara:strand:+ start:1058 stop:1447 length:390 start_codon:yes stop_codon:yes gene_type:complete
MKKALTLAGLLAINPAKAQETILTENPTQIPGTKYSIERQITRSEEGDTIVITTLGHQGDPETSMSRQDTISLNPGSIPLFGAEDYGRGTLARISYLLSNGSDYVLTFEQDSTGNFTRSMGREYPICSQ